VCERTARLIELVELPSVHEHSQKLLELLQERAATKPFWNVGDDPEQRQAICQALKQVISERK